MNTNEIKCKIKQERAMEKFFINIINYENDIYNNLNNRLDILKLQINEIKNNKLLDIPYDSSEEELNELKLELCDTEELEVSPKSSDSNNSFEVIKDVVILQSHQ